MKLLGENLVMFRDSRAPRAVSRRRVRIGGRRCTLAARRLGNLTDWHRINQFIFPFRTMISVGEMVNLRWFVPLDDHYATLALNEDADCKAISVDARNADSGLLPRGPTRPSSSEYG